MGKIDPGTIHTLEKISGAKSVLTDETSLAGYDNDEMSQALVDGELTWPDGVYAGMLPGTHAGIHPPCERSAS